MSRKLRHVDVSTDGGRTWTTSLTLPMFSAIVAEWHRQPADVAAVWAALSAGQVVASPVVKHFAYRDPDAHQRTLDLDPAVAEYRRLEARGLA